MILRSKYFPLKRPPRLIATYVYLLNYRSISISIINLLILTLNSSSHIHASNIEEDVDILYNSTVSNYVKPANDSWDLVYDNETAKDTDFLNISYKMKRAKHKKYTLGRDRLSANETEIILDEEHNTSAAYSNYDSNTTEAFSSDSEDFEDVTGPTSSFSPLSVLNFSSATTISDRLNYDTVNITLSTTNKSKRANSDKGMSTLLTPLDLTPLISKIKGKERQKSNKIELSQSALRADAPSPKTTEQTQISDQIEAYSIDIDLKGILQSENLFFNDTDKPLPGKCNNESDEDCPSIAFLQEKTPSSEYTTEYTWSESTISNTSFTEITERTESFESTESINGTTESDFSTEITVTKDTDAFEASNPYSTEVNSISSSLIYDYATSSRPSEMLQVIEGQVKEEKSTKVGLNVSAEDNEALWPVKLASVVEGDIILGGLMMVSFYCLKFLVENLIVNRFPCFVSCFMLSDID